MKRTIILTLLLTIMVGTAGAATKKGDVNGDGTVTIADVTELVNIILGKAENYDVNVADVNGDGSVTIADVTELVNIILGKSPGSETGDFSDDPAVDPANAPANPDDDSTTAVLRPDTGKQTKEGIYDISGQKLQQTPAQHGLYIVNGRKVLR
ncbi:MAG: dockerin type I repeat-containing protein [Prevotella sp.]|nr:dockerin type I repeat-containing protein [Prevotella sp.]